MSIIKNLEANYRTIARNESTQAAVAAIVENALTALTDEVSYEIENRDNYDLVNEWRGYDEQIYPMFDLDSNLGKMYPSDWENWKGYDFDMDDDYYCDDGTSGSLSDYADISEIVTAIYNGDIYNETTSEMDEITEEAHSLIEALQQEEEARKQAIETFRNLVNMIYNNGDLETVKAATIALWNING